MSAFNPHHLLEADSPRLLRQGDREFAALSLLQRVLLLTDGTLTKLLETYTQESLDVVKLAEAETHAESDIACMWVRAGRAIIRRTILLQGRTSRCNWLYAESVLIPDRLGEAFQYQLLSTRVPIGQLWIEHKLETFKELLHVALEPAAGTALYFNIAPDAPLLSRTYLVYTGRQPAMMITEKFPATYFAQPTA